MGPFDRRLLERATAVRSILLLDVAAGVVATLLLLAQMTLVGTWIARIVAGAATDSVGLVGALVLIVAIRAGLVQVVERSGRRAATTVMSALRTQLVQRRLRHGGADLDDLDSATVATAAVQGVDGLEVYFGKYLPQLVLAVVVPLAVIVWTAVVDLESAVIIVLTLPLIPLFLWLIGRATATRAAAGMSALTALSGHFLDLVRGLPTLRAFNRGAAQLPKIRETAEAYRRTTMRTLRLSFLSGTVLDLATTLSIALVAVTLGVRLVDGTIGLRPALIVLLLVPEVYAPIRAVGTLFHASADGLAGARTILDILDRPDVLDDQPVDRSALQDLSVVPVELRGVTVVFPGRGDPVLDQLDLVIGLGEVLAVTGSSGVGKTTLGRIVLGLVRPDEGAVWAGGRPRRDADLDAWRQQVAWAAQRPALVAATVRDNIALGQPGLADREVREAAVLAGAHEFIMGLPDGYETRIGDGGRGLSAGQRQRIGLARALARDVPLLVLDEPTANLDVATAAIVCSTVQALRGTRTVVVLTHDPALAAVADREVRLAQRSDLEIAPSSDTRIPVEPRS